MDPTPPRRTLLQAGLLLGAGLLAPRARACEYFSANLRITHPWTTATADGATTAVLSMRFDEVLQDDRLIGVITPVASGAETGGPGAGAALDIAIPQGRETVLHEAGTYVRLVGLTMPLQVARSYPLKLVFERGGVVGALLNVDYQRFR